MAGSVSTVSAQEENSGMKVFGLGLNFNQVLYFSYDYPVLSSNKILFTVTPVKYFRIEPAIGFSLYKDKEDDLTDQDLY